MVELNYHELASTEQAPADAHQQMSWRAVLVACLVGCVVAVLIAAGLVWWAGG